MNGYRSELSASNEISFFSITACQWLFEASTKSILNDFNAVHLPNIAKIALIAAAAFAIRRTQYCHSHVLISSRPPCQMADFPEELTKAIFTLISLEEIDHVKTVCKAWYRAWKSMRRDFTSLMTARPHCLYLQQTKRDSSALQRKIVISRIIKIAKKALCMCCVIGISGHLNIIALKDLHCRFEDSRVLSNFQLEKRDVILDMFRLCFFDLVLVSCVALQVKDLFSSLQQRDSRQNKKYMLGEMKHIFYLTEKFKLPS